MASDEHDWNGQVAHNPLEIPTTYSKNNSILSHAWQLKKDGRADATVETAVNRLKRLASLCNIDEPEQVKATLANVTWKNSSKATVARIYGQYLKYTGKTWAEPQYTVQDELPFIPTEQEIDTLVSAGTAKTATLLQLLKETGARIGEIARTKWINVDQERKTVYILAEKGSNSRILPISNKLIAMLNNLPHTDENVFQTDKHGLRRTFEDLRNRTATKLNNPRLKSIHLHTFRHWKATTEYHRTKDIIHVKTMLGHKSIESTMIYINIEAAIFLDQTDEWSCKATTNTNEATQLIESGFQYVVTTPDGLMLFKKRK